MNLRFKQSDFFNLLLIVYFSWRCSVEYKSNNPTLATIYGIVVVVFTVLLVRDVRNQGRTE